MHGTSRAGWPSEYKWLRAVPFLSPPPATPFRHGRRFLRFTRFVVPGAKYLGREQTEEAEQAGLRIRINFE